MNTLPIATKAAIVKALVEGASIRSIARMTGTSKTTVLKLLVEVGEFCSCYHDHVVRDIKASRVQADEIWAFIGAKAKNAKTEGFGDAWTFTAIDADTKLIISYMVGHRIWTHAEIFMKDLKSRLANRVQLTTDGHPMYPQAVEKAFGWNGCDYAQLEKEYAAETGGQHRYSPPICVGATKKWVMGKPAKQFVSTSFVERANLSMRMGMRRFTRLTNGFSKKLENHMHAVALHFFASNFCRAHSTLTKDAKGIHTSPAMAAGLTNHVWTIEEVLEMMSGQTPIG